MSCSSTGHDFEYTWWPLDPLRPPDTDEEPWSVDDAADYEGRGLDLMDTAIVGVDAWVHVAAFAGTLAVLLGALAARRWWQGRL